jgi:hypothetical protein
MAERMRIALNGARMGAGAFSLLLIPPSSCGIAVGFYAFGRLPPLVAGAALLGVVCLAGVFGAIDCLRAHARGEGWCQQWLDLIDPQDKEP